MLGYRLRRWFAIMPTLGRIRTCQPVFRAVRGESLYCQLQSSHRHNKDAGRLHVYMYLHVFTAFAFRIE